MKFLFEAFAFEKIFSKIFQTGLILPCGSLYKTLKIKFLSLPDNIYKVKD